MNEAKPLLQAHYTPGSYVGHAHHFGCADHLCQVFESEVKFVESLCNYIMPGIHKGEGVLVIATKENRKRLQEALENQDIDVTKAISAEQLIILDAEETLALFMVNDSPDPILFKMTVGKTLHQMTERFPHTRAYGEMVNILWHNNNVKATLELEMLWHNLTRHLRFTLYCGYPHHEDPIPGYHTHRVSE